MTIWRNFIQTFHRFISGATTVTEGKDTLHFRPSPARTRVAQMKQARRQNSYLMSLWPPHCRPAIARKGVINGFLNPSDKSYSL